MERRWTHGLTLGFSALGLFCWFVMFLAGTDVWHDVGRPAVWTLQGPPYHDLRVFLFGFYLLLVVLSADVLLIAVGLVKARRTATRNG